MSAIDMPPAAGVDARSSVVGNHSHTVAVSAAQLSRIRSIQSKSPAAVYWGETAPWSPLSQNDRCQ